jgi:hypothetical protein
MNICPICVYVKSSLTNNYRLRSICTISGNGVEAKYFSTITFVNSLDLGISRYFESLKYSLKQNYYKDARPLSYYDIRCRYLIIVHTEIKNSCSALHNDLFHVNICPICVYVKSSLTNNYRLRSICTISGNGVEAKYFFVQKYLAKNK